MSRSRAKAAFVTLSVAVNAALAVLAGALGVVDTTASELAWAGAVLTCGGYALFFGWLYAFDVPRTSRWPAVLLVPEIWGALLAIAAVGVPAQQWPARGVALVGVVSSIAYLRWYSRLGRGPSKLARNEPLPAFELRDLRGDVVSSTVWAGAPTVLLFVRGNWCPLCVAQVQEVAAQYRELAARGARVVVVSPQSERSSKNLAARFDAPIEFLVDDGGAAARALGLFHEGGVPAAYDIIGFGTDTVFPTVVITDERGVVRFLDETDDYRARPEPRLFLRALDEIGFRPPAPPPSVTTSEPPTTIEPAVVEPAASTSSPAADAVWGCAGS